MIGRETARQLLYFGGSVSDEIAEGQLEGAVAIHNILEKERVAYLADEVGMGKTYIALGVLALFRHFDPTFRAMVIAPREIIQKKWKKEYLNFVANNVRFSDLRVRAPHGAPVRSMVLCRSLLSLVREATLDPDRDLLLRLTSFSLGGSAHEEGWRSRRDELLGYLPWLDPALFDLRNRDAFKDSVARAVCCALPDIDLLIVDEGHNLKGGFGSGAVRNRVLGLAFGRSADDADLRSFPGYGRRVKRLLLLSATPVENDYSQLWNQLDVFGFGGGFDVLTDRDASDEEKKECARRFLVRRLATVRSSMGKLTKNLYRREWRKGGVDLHDEPLAVPDARQRLIVALVQKKVSETIRSTRFNNSFQIGMLASFESFLETVGAKKKGEVVESNFDDAEQTEDEAERLGADVPTVNRMAKSYRRKFDDELPHPKMDSVVKALAEGMNDGHKALVFVRRVASVRELKRRLDRRYDRALRERLRAELDPVLWPAMEKIFDRYREERRSRRHRQPEAEPLSAVIDEVADAAATGPLDDETLAPVDDKGGSDTFFEWFFRGVGPTGVLSGATMQRRFSSQGSVLSTFFDENHAAWLLGVEPSETGPALADYLSLPLDHILAELERRAPRYLSRARKPQRRNLFLAFQRVAVELLAEAEGPLRERAERLRQLRYASQPAVDTTRQITGALEYLSLETLFTALRQRPALEAGLVPPAAAGADRERIREREIRRELLSAAGRLGHPSIDIFVLVANRTGSLDTGSRDPSGSESLADAWLDLLETQRNAPGHTGFAELAAAADHFDLIVDVNVPEVRTAELEQATTLFGRLMREQQPVGGMAGQVNETLVRQFRMPGYPLVLITTDLLQEGEDLHTFCSRVYHYGISWMPSSMEQRIGRIDRVNSHTHRRLRDADGSPSGEDLLQVFLPHLRDTVEVLQVERVLDRMNRFMRLMHEDLVSAEKPDGRLDVTREILQAGRDIARITQPLETAFPVPDWAVPEDRQPLATAPTDAQALMERFRNLRQTIDDPEIAWRDQSVQPPHELLAEIALGERRQPFTLFLRPVDGWYAVRCVSPVGIIDPEDLAEEHQSTLLMSGTKITLVPVDRAQAYNVAVEGAVLLAAPAHDRWRIGRLIRAVTAEADRLEKEYLHIDTATEYFEEELMDEVNEER